jgi:hypothetical protein
VTGHGWAWQTRPACGGTPLTATLTSQGLPATFHAVIDAWSGDQDLRTLFTTMLRDVPYRAYCWETPALTRATLDRPFECAFVESRALESARPDPEPFREHFAAERADVSVVTFESLGRDALLVAPCPRAELAAYTHLAAFVRVAPPEQVHELWRVLAQAFDARLGTSPLWLSTAGLGVHWLHIRIDTRPKYYRHRAYAEPAGSQG